MKNWTSHEIASVKTAYLDWHYQHVMIVHLWCKCGSIGIK